MTRVFCYDATHEILVRISRVLQVTIRDVEWCFDQCESGRGNAVILTDMSGTLKRQLFDVIASV